MPETSPKRDGDWKINAYKHQLVPKWGNSKANKARASCIVMRALRSGLHFVLWSSRTKSLVKKKTDPAQNTNNFNDNLNNKTIFSLNATNRAGRFFLCIDIFYSPERFSLLRDRSEMKNVVKNIWLLWHAMLAVLSPERRKNLSKRETRDRRRGSFFAFPRIDLVFFEKFY